MQQVNIESRIRSVLNAVKQSYDKTHIELLVGVGNFSHDDLQKAGVKIKPGEKGLQAGLQTMIVVENRQTGERFAFPYKNHSTDAPANRPVNWETRGRIAARRASRRKIPWS